MNTEDPNAHQRVEALEAEHIDDAPAPEVLAEENRASRRNLKVIAAREDEGETDAPVSIDDIEVPQQPAHVEGHHDLNRKSDEGDPARLRRPPTLEPSSVIVMQAHLRIQPGGSHDIPRLYVHDDTKGTTGKIHVGFFGPNYLMPNTKTN